MAETTWIESLGKSLGGADEVALLLVDVDQIHNYVFESAKLAEMRGASLILDLLNVGGLDEAGDADIRIDNERIRGIGDAIKEEGLDPEINVIYSGGGGALLALPPGKAAVIQTKIEQLYLQTTLTVTVTTVCRVLTLEQLKNGFPPPGREWFTRLASAGPLARKLVDTSREHSAGNDKFTCGFGQILAGLSYEARRKKDSKVTAPIFEVSPFTERCAYCHYRPAFKLAEEVDERPICMACDRKRDAGDKQSGHGHYLKSFRQYLPADHPYVAAVRKLGQRANLGDDAWAELKSPPDLEAIGEYSSGKPSNYLGIIYADGNEMGKAIESVRSAEDLRYLSRAIRDSIKESVFSGLARFISGPCTVKRDKARRDGSVHSLAIHYHPFEIVSIGGDDVYLFVPSDIALELASHICTDFAHRFQERVKGTAQARFGDMSLSAGVLIAQVASPIYFSRRIVEGLLKSAKAKSKESQTAKPAIDYQVIATDTAISEDVQAFRDIAYANRFEGERLTTRPLLIKELDELVGTIKRLKAAGFPLSQLYQLREALVLGPQPRASNFYNYQRSRNRKLRESYAPLHEMLSRGHSSEEYLPMWKEGDTRVTPIPDIAEIYSFVREAQAGSEQ